MTCGKVKRMPHIVSVMTPFPYSIGIHESVRSAREMMGEHDVRHLPVKDQGSLVGVLTDTDITRALDPSLGFPPPEELRVEDVCVLEAYIVGHTEPLDNVVLEMAKSRIGSALVVKEDRLVGIFTVTDACRCFGEMLRSFFAERTDDGVA